MTNNEDEITKLKRLLNEEKNKNINLIKEIEILKNKNIILNNDNNSLKEQIKILENNLKAKNNELQNLLSKNNNNNIINYKITSINPGEEILAINFVSNGVQDIGHYNLICKNTDLFVRLEERLYQDFPDFKNYETYFDVNTKRIKRFKTVEENNIKNNDIINVFRIEE
jgi:seryl-tRNA synthetase